MRLALSLAFIAALTAPAMAQTITASPVPHRTATPDGGSVTTPKVTMHPGAATAPAPSKGPSDLADQVAAAIRNLEAGALHLQQFYRHFAYSVYAPICAGHKGLSNDPKVPAVTWVHNGEAWPAMVKCADGYGKGVSGP